MRAWLAGLFVPFLFLVPATRAAAEPPVDWRCLQLFDESFHVRCTPFGGGADAGDKVPAGDGPAPRLDMRPVAQRGSAEVYSTDAWLVPLHARPTDAAMVVQLLQSVLCGRHAACTVAYGGTAPLLARR